MSDVVKVLQGTKSLLEKCGWIQGDYGDSTRGYCLRGALYDIPFYAHVSTKVEDALQTVLEHRNGTNLLAHYNDMPSTTKEDILSLIDEAILIAEEKDSE